MTLKVSNRFPSVQNAIVHFVEWKTFRCEKSTFNLNDLVQNFECEWNFYQDQNCEVADNILFWLDLFFSWYDIILHAKLATYISELDPSSMANQYHHLPYNDSLFHRSFPFYLSWFRFCSINSLIDKLISAAILSDSAEEAKNEFVLSKKKNQWMNQNNGQKKMARSTIASAHVDQT